MRLDKPEAVFCLQDGERFEGPSSNDVSQMCNAYVAVLPPVQCLAFYAKPGVAPGWCLLVKVCVDIE
ncbi:hypothetical protein NDU88_001501 [Pleurodeles waltl]|uniref:Uncharacterized protein n=1 Tax=Pleurodeles waltl TaxID=8319 RepID=A0AAV7VZE2_PLEWA|nr:hypothetical protein NDU88_001501 [Pleurodeles waltl]